MKKQCLLISPPGELNIFPRGIMEIATFLNEKGCPATVLPLDHYITNNYTIDVHGYMKRDFDKKEEADFTFSKFKEFFEKGLLQSGYAFIFVPYPGTQYFNNPGDYGIQLLSNDWRKWRRWTNEPVSCLDNFSRAEIVVAFEKAKKLLDTYKTLNVYLYKPMNR
jgi:hypothetical protein